MFDETPELYDVFYGAVCKDYPAEAAAVLAHVRAANPEAATLLDVACGTGRHLEVFSEELSCIGVDLDEDLLEIAERRCPDVRFERADMVGFDLGERFDAVVCLFSSIGYARTVDRLDAAVAAMARHLRPGGVLVVEPSFTPGEWVVGRVMTLHVDRPDLQAVRMSVSGRRDDVALIDLHYVIGADGDVTYRQERHELGLFDWKVYVDAFERYGLRVTVDEEGLIGRGLIIGVLIEDRPHASDPATGATDGS